MCLFHIGQFTEIFLLQPTATKGLPKPLERGGHDGGRAGQDPKAGGTWWYLYLVVPGSR